jgi:hypothetical protein
LPVPGEDGDSFVCTNCGDGVCSAGEGSDYCWEDCAADFECLPGWIKTEFGCEEPAIDLGLKTGANQYYDLGGYFGIEKIVIESDYEQLIKVIRIYDPSASFGSMRSPESWVKVAENVELSPGVREVIDVSIRGGRVIRLVFDSEYANAGDVSFVGYVGGEIGLSPPVEEGNLVLGIVLLVVIGVLISWLVYSRDGRRKRRKRK